jgi:hypothetical protein
MHLKDPPPGSNMPLGKVHPWMEDDESGKTPAFFATPGDERMQGGPEIMEIVEEEEEDLDKMKVQQMVKERFKQIPPGSAPDEEFLKPENTASERKLRIMGASQPEAPQDLHRGLAVREEPPEPQLVQRTKSKQVPLNENPADMLHATGPDGEDFDDSDFANQFNSDTAPSQDVIDKALKEAVSSR